jgi:hypothetical protein
MSCIPLTVENNAGCTFFRLEIPRAALMDGNTIIGCTIVLASLSAITVLVWWSRRCIRRIAKDKPRTARQALKELNGGR